jgi:hypothetical protein
MIQNELAAALDPNARPPLIPRGFCFLVRASETLERKARATPVRACRAIDRERPFLGRTETSGFMRPSIPCRGHSGPLCGAFASDAAAPSPSNPATVSLNGGPDTRQISGGAAQAKAADSSERLDLRVHLV